ncbi:MAG: hypothetical protein HXY47_07005 [Nitrospirae bacterium]|nr:hypothetical protein [Nitrospirota bacterium]
MIYGYRVIGEEEIGLYPVSLIQISVFKGWVGGVEQMMKVVSACRSLNLRYVIHPLGYFLSETRHEHRKETMDAMQTFARNVDLALIIHDETTPWGSRLEGIYEEAYKEALHELSAICPVSIENANNTLDIKWFWKRFATSITLDIGHVEAAGIDSERFVIELGEDIIDKLNYVHLHRYNGHHDGLLDHWSLLVNCRELRAFEHLLKRKQDIGVILEINDMENLGENLRLIKKYI